MKIKRLLSVATLLAGALGINAQTDVTSTYLKNASFEYSEEGVPFSEDTKELENGEGIYGWTGATISNTTKNIQITKDASSSGFGKTSASDGDYFYFIRQGWEDKTSSITQSVNLPKGRYYLSVDYKQAESHDDGKFRDSKVGLTITKDEMSLVALSTVGSVNAPGDTYFTDIDWKQIGTWFDVEETSDVTIALTFELKGSSKRTDLCLDNVKLYKWDLDDQANYDNASTTNPMDVTSKFVINPYFDANTNGWTSTTGAQNSNRASNQTGVFSGHFWENWNGSAYTGKMHQVIDNIPNGVYELGICAFVNTFDASCQHVYAGNYKTALTTGEPTAYKVRAIVVNNKLEIGLEQTAPIANWMGIDNVSLAYCGAASEEDLAPFFEEYKSLASALLDKPMSSVAKFNLETAMSGSSLDALVKAYNEALNSVKSNQILALGTLPDNSIEGWTCTNSNTFHINTWSVEGDTDGTDMRKPFIENWVGKPGPLGAGTISYTMEGIEPGTYTVEARIRIYSESGAEPAGATYFANETSIDIAEGNHFEYNGMKGIYDTYKVKCVVGEDGKLTFGVNITEPTFNWVAIKGIKVKDSSPSLGTPAITPENGSNVMLNEFAGVSISFPESFNLEDVSKENLTYTLTAQLINTTDDAVVATEEINGAYDATYTAFATTKLNANKTYKVVIPAGSIVLNDGTTDIYTNKIEYGTQFSAVLGTLKAGTYFIQNAESGRYLVGGNSWGTQASLHKHGIDFIVTLNNGKYNLDSKISNGGNNHFLGDNLYVDSGAFGWSIVMQEDGTYTISNGSNYLVENAGSSVLATATDGTAANARWNFISIEDVLKMAEYTTSEAPLDMTGFIMDYGFGRNNTRNSSWLGDDPAYRFDENGVYSNAEFYNKTFNLYQEITGLPKGTYMVKVQGYYRDGTSADAASKHESGTENLNAVLYAVGKTSVSTPLKSIFDADLANMTTTGNYSETFLGKVPNDMTAANHAFAAGMYEGNSAIVSVGSDGKLTIGIKQATTGSGANWTIFDNFELYYLGSTDTKFSDAGETTYSLSDATALTDGETVEVNKTQIANGVVVSFPDAVVEHPWNAGFRAYTIVKEEGGTVYHLKTNADENNTLNVAKGLFKANRTYEVTIEHIDYLDYTRFCDEDPNLLALGFDGCDPMPLWSTDSWSSDRGSFSVTIKTDETVVEDNASAAKQIVFVEGGEATGIEGINTETVSTEYFNLNGVRVAAPQKGLNIIKKRMTDGSVKTLKVMVK